MLTRLVSWWEAFELFLAHVSGIICLVMAFSISYEVIARYIFSSATSWSTSLNLYTVICITFLAGAWTALVGGHVRVDILFIRLRGRAHAIVDIVGTVIGLVFIIYLTIACFKMYLQALRLGLTSIEAMGWPLSPLYIVMIIGSILLGLELISHLIKTSLKLRALSKPAAQMESSASSEVL